MSVNMRNVLLFAALSLVPSCRGQFSSTVEAKILNNSSTGISAAIPNIGQSAHYVTVVPKDAPAHSCGGFYRTGLFGSSDGGVTLIALPGNKLSNNTGSPVRTYQWTGTFPSLVLQLANIDATNCVYDAYYSGTLYPAPLPALCGSSTCGNPTPFRFTTSTMGDNTVQAVFAWNTFAIYGLTVCNATAGQTVQIKAGTNILFEIPNMAAGQCFDHGYTQFPLIDSGTNAANVGLSLVVNLSANTLVDFQFTYRFE